MRNGTGISMPYVTAIEHLAVISPNGKMIPENPFGQYTAPSEHWACCRNCRTFQKFYGITEKDVELDAFRNGWRFVWELDLVPGWVCDRCASLIITKKVGE